MVTTVLILSYLGEARRVAQHNGGRTPTRGVAAVVITVIIYCVSTIPTIWAYIYTYTDRGADIDLLSWFSTCFTGLNVMCNIYVYYLTIPSLREFIRVKILQLTPLRPQPGACSSRFVWNFKLYIECNQGSVFPVLFLISRKCLQLLWIRQFKQWNGQDFIMTWFLNSSIFCWTRFMNKDK